MKLPLTGVLLLMAIIAGCGSGGNSAGVTPVMANTRGSYRLDAATVTITPPAGAPAVFSSFSSGSLRLTDTSYTLSIEQNGAVSSHGSYAIGGSVNTILNTRRGSFTLTASNPPQILTGSYEAISDFTLRLDYNQFPQPDGSIVVRSETWVKESDSPHFRQ